LSRDNEVSRGEKSKKRWKVKLELVIGFGDEDDREKWGGMGSRDDC
jgi:hypothetical protein